MMLNLCIGVVQTLLVPQIYQRLGHGMGEGSSRHPLREVNLALVVPDGAVKLLIASWYQSFPRHRAKRHAGIQTDEASVFSAIELLQYGDRKVLCERS